MTTTSELIESLSQDLPPVAPVREPLKRACVWLLAIVALVAVAAYVGSTRLIDNIVLTGKGTAAAPR